MSIFLQHFSPNSRVALTAPARVAGRLGYSCTDACTRARILQNAQSVTVLGTLLVQKGATDGKRGGNSPFGSGSVQSVGVLVRRSFSGDAAQLAVVFAKLGCPGLNMASELLLYSIKFE